MAETRKTKTRAVKVLQGILTGNWFSNVFLIKYRWYVLLLFGLALLYMGSHYYMEKTAKELGRQEVELMKLRDEYTRCLLRQESLIKRSAILKQVEDRKLELKEPKQPAKKIKMN
jgi:Tfp pilus assembly protein PilO